MKCYTETELSEMIGVSVKTLRAGRLKGRGIPYVKLGRLVRYRQIDVESYLEKNLCSTGADK